MRRFYASSILCAFFACASSCGSLSDDLRLCGEIPRGGCPLGRGGSCDDDLCAGLYDCVDGSWTLARSCAGGGQGGAGGGTGTGGEGGACSPITLDHAGETEGCKPDLESPDCPAAAAETCAASACLTECADFFLCTADGWSLVAFCDEDAALTVLQ